MIYDTDSRYRSRHSHPRDDCWRGGDHNTRKDLPGERRLALMGGAVGA